LPVVIWSLRLVGANSEPFPARQSSSSRAKWVTKTGLHQPSGAPAFVEWSSAVYSQTPEIGVSDTPTDRGDLRRLSPRHDLPPARMLARIRQLINPPRSPASSLLVSHPCSYTRNPSLGAFTSVRRVGCLCISNGHAGRGVSDIQDRCWGVRGQTVQILLTRCKLAA
jgi:hypothetical protein